MTILEQLKDLKEHKGFEKYFKNTSWLFVEKTLRIVVGLFIGIWVARYLGPEKFGLFSYAQSFVGLFSAIATLGLDSIVIRELVKDENQRDKLLGTAFVLKLIGAAVVLSLLAFSYFLQVNNSEVSFLIFIIASSTIFQSFNVIDFYFRSIVMSRFVVFSNVFSLLVSSIIKVILLCNEAPLVAFSCVIAFDSIVLASGYTYFYFKRNMTISNWTFDKKLAKSLLFDSWPLIVSGLAVMLQARIDQVMLKQMIGDEEVGQYSVALRLVEMFDFFSVMFTRSIMPAIVNAKQKSEKLYQHRLYAIYKVMMISFLLIFTFNITFGENIILILYGNSYSIAATLFPIFSIRTLFTNYAMARGLFITNNNLFKYTLIFVLLGAFINILLNYVLIPEYKSFGALIATVITYTLTVFIINLLFKETRLNGILMLKSLFTFFTIKIKDIK
ncbi:flippase [Vibrio sp. RC27]